MVEMGHESAALALEVYARMMARQTGTGAAPDELVPGPEWAQMGTNSLDEAGVLSDEEMSESVKPLGESV
jgi:hypothetical protein